MRSSLKEGDFFAKVNETGGATLDEFLKNGGDGHQEEYVYPLFTDYKLVSLD